MLQRYRNLPVAWQVLIITVALCATMFSAFTAFVAWSTERASMRQTESDLRIQLDSVAGMLDYAYDNAKARAVRQMEIFRTLLKGKIQPDGTTMLTGETKDIPVLKLGDEVLNNNKKYLDQIREYTGAIAGILVRQGDTFFRVTSAVKDQKGRNTTGLPLPAWDTSTASLLKGEPHLSVALRPHNYYMVYLTPLFDDSHRVIGALDIRLDLTPDIESLKQRMKAIKVGETGFLFSFLPVPGEDLAMFVVHPELQAQMAGKALDETAKARLTRTLAAKGGLEIFDAPDKADGGRIKPRIEMYRHIPSWNWMVGTGSFVDEFVQESRSLRNMLTLISVLCGLATALLLYFAIRNRLAPLGEVLRQVTLIGEGDLTVRMRDGDPLSQNEMDLLATRLNATTGQVAELIGSINRSASSVGEAAGELQHSADQIAGASQQQSQGASSVAAAVEQLSVSIAHVAENAKEAHQVTDDASQVSNRGKDVVGRAVKEMEQVATEIGDMASLVKSLGERSQHISGIVGVIKEIADQTNLLALNAAIEAARAGEQGRGFAVVADEVRSLAERTSRSTEEIAGMIGAVQSETIAVVKRMESVTGSMQGGLELAREAGTTLGDIHGRMGRTVNAIEEIANATREQKAASEQIARNVESIAHMAEESSSLTEQNRSAAKGLLALAAQLDAMVKRFRVG